MGMPLEPLLPPQLPTAPPGLTQRLATLAEGARAGQTGARAELQRACQMVEAHFVTWLLTEMRQTLPRDGLLPHGPTEETCEGLLDDALARAVARGGGIGLARSLEAQLSRPGTAAAGQPTQPTTSSQSSPAETR